MKAHIWYRVLFTFALVASITPSSGSDDIFLGLGDDDLLDFSLDPLRYHSKELLSIPTDDIASIQLTTPNQSIQLDRKRGAITE